MYFTELSNILCIFTIFICVRIDKIILTLPSNKVKENYEANLKLHCVMYVAVIKL